MKELINNNVDIIMISETNMKETFPEVQFCTDEYSTPYLLDRNSNGGGILMYVKEDLHDTFKGFFIKTNLRTKVAS